MSQESNQPNAEQSDAPVANPPVIKILGQFIRDFSFENIVSRNPVPADSKPNISIQVAMDAKKREQEHQFEVLSKYTIESKTLEGDHTLFMIELEYCGILHIENIPTENLHPFLMIEGPRLLFPFVRRIVSDITHDGGFPPLNMDQIDFVALYRDNLKKRAEAQKAEENATNAVN